MRISGLQKLTLLDYPGMVACTVFTPGCNFRCPFCHNAPLVIPERLFEDTTTDEVLAFLKKRQGVLDGVAITGGEPLIHDDIDGFLADIKGLGYKIKLDTNGSFPSRLKRIVAAGLVDRVAMDIKNAPGEYGRTIGVESFDISPIEESKAFLMQSGIDYEFRTTVVKGIHTAENIRAAAKWISGAREYYLQQFKDSGDVIKIDGLDAYNKEEMDALCLAAAEFVPSAAVRGV